MSNLKMLYYYELKKLWKRKMIWVTLLIFLVATAITMLGELIGYYYIGSEKADTKYHMFLVDREYQKQLDGREIDQSLLEEMSDAYGRIPMTAEKYSLTEEYQKYARPYCAVFNFVRDTTRMTVSEMMQWIPDLEDFYRKRQTMLEEDWESCSLSDGEKEFWRQKEAELEVPFVYRITESYNMLLQGVATVGVLVLLSVSICLSGVFAEEHTRRTDQLILCSKHGKDAEYWAKVLAGVSFAVGVSFLLFTFAAILAFGVYGAEGFDAAFQLIFAKYSYPITVGQMVFILYGCVMVTAVIFSVFVMVLSELFHSGIATLAVTSGMIILSMICSVPVQYRIAAQIWNWFPSSFLAPWNIFDVWMVSVFGHYFTAWQVVPVIYVVISVGISAIGKIVYRRFQISGR